MDKSREELEKEYAEATVKLEQYQHKGQRLENRIKYYQQGDRKKRNHRLITRGADVENVAREVRGMSQAAFRILVEQIFQTHLDLPPTVVPSVVTCLFPMPSPYVFFLSFCPVSSVAILSALTPHGRTAWPPHGIPPRPWHGGDILPAPRTQCPARRPMG